MSVTVGRGTGDRGVHIEVMIAASGFKVIISLILRTNESKLAIILSERGQKDTENHKLHSVE